MRKVYVVQKYVVATSVDDALKKEKDITPDECYLDEVSKKFWIEDRMGVNANVGYERR